MQSSPVCVGWCAAGVAANRGASSTHPQRLDYQVVLTYIPLLGNSDLVRRLIGSIAGLWIGSSSGMYGMDLSFVVVAKCVISLFGAAYCVVCFRSRKIPKVRGSGIPKNTISFSIFGVTV